MKKKQMIFLLLLILVLLAGMIFLVRKRKLELAKMRRPVQYRPVVQVVSVKKGAIDVSVKYLGEIIPVTETQIASKVTGYIEKIFVDDGARVSKGSVLVKIDDRDVKAHIESIEARIEAAQGNLEALEAKLPGLKSAVYTNRGIYERNRILYRNKAIGKEELDISKKNFELALSELKATEKSIWAQKQMIASLKAQKRAEEVLLSYTTIRAPFNGIVQRRELSEGDIAVPGKPILSIIRPDAGVKVVVEVAPEDFVKIKPGTSAKLILSGKAITTKVSSLYPAASPSSLGICNILLEKAPFGLPYHTRIEVEIITEKPKGLIAPSQCLLRQGNINFVIKVDDKGIAHKIPVKILGTNEKHICFASSHLREGDFLVIARESRLTRISDGQSVEVTKRMQEASID
ncbi:MAG TPA: efflux RND transporter periplasmic adaptor subunit [Thermodesulforhabdus norvegica]|uniref:Efflux RND transporter periplasmic adaptor subunit n=1 Tax=Thermodesulforhabdus norvegica TaxID=39841 RepID=A0A7C0WTY9_9BACT|nr:efflux RND transporter periplasmic adaptor subunit [Thermodesulforhabdus norvegica]